MHIQCTIRQTACWRIFDGYVSGKCLITVLDWLRVPGTWAVEPPKLPNFIRFLSKFRISESEQKQNFNTLPLQWPGAKSMRPHPVASCRCCYCNGEILMGFNGDIRPVYTSRIMYISRFTTNHKSFRLPDHAVTYSNFNNENDEPRNLGPRRKPFDSDIPGNPIVPP